MLLIHRGRTIFLVVLAVATFVSDLYIAPAQGLIKCYSCSSHWKSGEIPDTKCDDRNNWKTEWCDGYKCGYKKDCDVCHWKHMIADGYEAKSIGCGNEKQLQESYPPYGKCAGLEKFGKQDQNPIELNSCVCKKNECDPMQPGSGTPVRNGVKCLTCWSHWRVGATPDKKCEDMKNWKEEDCTRKVCDDKECDVCHWSHYIWDGVEGKQIECGNEEALRRRYPPAGKCAGLEKYDITTSHSKQLESCFCKTDHCNPKPATIAKSAGFQPMLSFTVTMIVTAVTAPGYLYTCV